MILYYRVLGVLLLIICVVLAIIFYTMVDLRSVTAANPFAANMLESPGVLRFIDSIRTLGALFMIVAGIGIGSFCFGIGQILSKLKHRQV